MANMTEYKISIPEDIHAYFINHIMHDVKTKGLTLHYATLGPEGRYYLYSVKMAKVDATALALAYNVRFTKVTKNNGSINRWLDTPFNGPKLSLRYFHDGDNNA